MKCFWFCFCFSNSFLPKTKINSLKWMLSVIFYLFLETVNSYCQKVILKANLRWGNYISETEEFSTKLWSGFLHVLHWKLGIHRYGTMTWMSQTWIRLLFGRMTSFILLSPSEKCQELKLNLNYSLCYKGFLEKYMTLVFQKKSPWICIKFATHVSLLFIFEVWKTPKI